MEVFGIQVIERALDVDPHPQNLLPHHLSGGQDQRNLGADAKAGWHRGAGLWQVQGLKRGMACVAGARRQVQPVTKIGGQVEERVRVSFQKADGEKALGLCLFRPAPPTAGQP